MADVTPRTLGGRRRLIIPMQKNGMDPLRLAHVQPVAIETEISLADRQQPVAMGTMKTGVPEGGDR